MYGKPRLFVSACLVGLLSTTAAFAQEAAAAQDGGEEGGYRLEEVVVTAERREASLQDVPISVTALTSERLEAKQIVDITTMAKVVPGMQSRQTLTPLELAITIRGVTQLVPNLTLDPPIGSYVDGVYNVVNAGSNNAMIDMERVEVLKGPQGTLFGRNTIGGAISITTAKPTPNFGGYVEGSVGNYDTWRLTGVVNVPIVPDALETRLVYQHAEHGGYGRNLTTGAEVDTFEQDYFRGTVKATLGENWSAVVTGFYTEAEGFSAPTRLRFIDPAARLPGQPPMEELIPTLSGRPGDKLSNYIGAGGYRNSFSDVDNEFYMKQFGLSSTITGELNEAVSVKWITGYTDTQYNTISDVDGSPYIYLHLVHYPINAKQFSQEFQVYGDAFDDRLKWIAGAYYFDVKGSHLGYSRSLAALSPPAARFVAVSGPAVNNKSYSAFAQATYEAIPGLRITAGARYVADKRNVLYRDHRESVGVTDEDGYTPGPYLACAMANAPLDPNPANCVFKASVDYSYVPWTVGLDYRPNDDTLFYAKISKGFRAGAFSQSAPAAVLTSATVTPAQAAAANARAIAAFEPVAPERLLSPEVGAKFEFLDRRLRVNVAAYYSEYDNIQLSVKLPPDPACPACGVPGKFENSGKAEIWGGELEVAALLGGLQLDASLGIVRPKYVEGPNVGTPIVNVSKFNGSFTGAYPIDLGAGVLNLSATYSYRSKAVFALTSGLPAGAIEALTQEGFGLLDARASSELRGAPVVVSVYGTNLTDKDYVTSVSNFANPLGQVVGWPGAPRTYGVSVKYSF